MSSKDADGVVAGRNMKNRETDEVVVIKSVGYFVRYENDEVDGEVQRTALEAHFELI